MNRTRSTTFWVFTAYFAVTLFSCSSNNNPSAPLSQFQPEIVNNPDAFSFQATAVQNVNSTLTYTWPNSGSQATVNHSSVVTGGSAAITIYDTNDSLVYTKGLVASATEASTIGVAGNWRMVVTLTNCYGTLNFSVQKL